MAQGTDGPSLAEVIGPMLGATHAFAAGVAVQTRPREGPYVVRFWQFQGRSWRLEVDGGPITVIGPDSSVVRMPDGGLHRGPRKNLGNQLPALLLMPVSAYIWGRPGEDWRLAGDVTALDGGRVRVGLVHVQDATRVGHAVVVLRSGHIEELQQDGTRTWLAELRFHAEPGDDLADLFTV